MSIPIGFKYHNNMAFYPIKALNILYAEDYGENLETRYDNADKILYRERIFCVDCFDYKTCKGRCWMGCPYRAKALIIIRG